MALGSVQNYNPIFHMSEEVPPLVVRYRWWEDEATTIFWAFDIKKITAVIRYKLYHEEILPREALLSRNGDTLGKFLLTLLELREPQTRGHHQRLRSLSHSQKVDEILLRSSISPCQYRQWSWFPPQPRHSLDAPTIAAAIEAESHSHFKEIPFEEIVYCALGKNAVSVEWFLQQHSTLYTLILKHLCTYPEEMPLYTEVEKILQSQSPFAHRALVQCILGNHHMPQPSTPCFQFVVGAIQHLFQGSPCTVTNILEKLSVLETRYQEEYVYASSMSWTRDFGSSISSLDK